MSQDSLCIVDENMMATRNQKTHTDSKYFFKSINNTTPGSGLNHEITDSTANRNGALGVGRF